MSYARDLLLHPIYFEEMMRFIICVLAALLINSCSVSQQQVTTASNATALFKENTYFVEIPIEKLSSIQCPCINVEINSKELSMELDLGFRGDLSIEEDQIDLVSNKSFISERLIHGIRGKQYPVKIFRIPKAKIGKMTFISPRLEKESREFIQDSTFVADGSEPSPREKGRIGWELFRKVNLLIDMKNAKIALCDSLDTLAKRGCTIEKFIKTPLILDHGLVQITGNTSEGPLRCVLDTGTTWNILNQPIQSNQSIDQAIWEPENILELADFKINEEDFGPLCFHRMPVQLPFLVEAILGIEFFKQNLVYLDFVKGFAYFLKRPPANHQDPKEEIVDHLAEAI